MLADTRFSKALMCLATEFHGERSSTLTAPLVQLHQAKITVDHPGIRIEGKEDEWRRKERTSYDQVLWCRPVSGDSVKVSYR